MNRSIRHRTHVVPSFWRGLRYALLMDAAIVLFVLLCAKAARCEQLPEAPKAKKPTLDRTERVLLWTEVGTRAMDTITTRVNLEHGAHETDLPPYIVGHTWTMLAYSEGTVLEDVMIARYLTRHHHPKLAHLWLFAEVGRNSSDVIGNFCTEHTMKARRQW